MSQKSLDPSEEPTPKQRKELIAEISHRSGPLPSSEELAEYDRILPGLANRIMKLAETEQEHTTFIDKFERIAYWFSRLLAQGGVLAVVILILIGSYYLILDGHLAGGIIGVVTAVGTVLTSIIKNAGNR